jgi:hypothetical protein
MRLLAALLMIACGWCWWFAGTGHSFPRWFPRAAAIAGAWITGLLALLIAQAFFVESTP